MSRSRQTKAEMIAALNQVKAGRKVGVCGEGSGSKHTIYGWKAKYRGMDVNEVQGVKKGTCPHHYSSGELSPFRV